MTVPPHSRTHPAARRWEEGLERDAVGHLVTFGVMVLLCALTAGRLAGFGLAYVLKAATLYAGCTGLIWRSLPASHPHGRLGPANRVTLARIAIAALLAALVGQPMARPDTVAWCIVVIATGAALLDLVDGKLARRSGLSSDFGARFDMETDAWFTLVLCSLIVFFDKAGPWVLAAGLMRYAFVMASRLWPWLAAPLPPNTRRKAVCVTQITILITCLGPIIPRTASSTLAALGLALLTWSFAIDIRTLHRGRRP